MDTSANLLEMTATIVANYVENNSVSASDLAGLIQTVHKSLVAIDTDAVEPEPTTKATAAQIRKSIRPEGLTSFIDGKIYKTLRRHLTTNGSSPDEYRERFGLPKDYPMVSGDYSAARSALAKAAGLGQGGRGGPAKAQAAQAAAKPRGRPKKV